MRGWVRIRTEPESWGLAPPLPHGPRAPTWGLGRPRRRAPPAAGTGRGRAARQAAGPVARPHHAAVSHRARRPRPPALTNSALPGNRRRGPAPSARESRVRASCRVEAARGSGTCGLTEIKDSDRACSPGGRRHEGSGDSCGSVGVGGQRVCRRKPDAPLVLRRRCRGQGMAPCTRRGVRRALRSWAGAVTKGSKPFL